MARNVKALNDSELHYIKTKYSFELQGDYIYVSYIEYNRKVVHPITESFILSTKVRKVTITKEANGYGYCGLGWIKLTLLDKVQKI